jgi:hypothetical protein
MFDDHALAQVVSCQSLSAEADVHSQASLCGICGGQSGTQNRVFSEYCGFPLSLSFYQYSILIE